MSDYIPQELLISILVRLPVKNIIQCSSVCKSWYTLITSSFFITTHLNESKLNKQPYLFVQHQTLNPIKKFYSLYHDDNGNGTLGKHTGLDIPSFEGSFSHSLNLHGVCNGLICLSFVDGIVSSPIIILWNPSIKKFVSLPRPRLPYSMLGVHSIGFGFDPVTDDYKIVRICGAEFPPRQIQPEVEIFSLNKACWGDITGVPTRYLALDGHSKAFINGAAHWVAPRFEDQSNGLIVVFDFIDELFLEMMLPDSLVDGEYVSSIHVTVFEERLSLIEQKYRDFAQVCGIWTMKEYGVAESWTKILSIDLGKTTLLRPIGLTNNGGILFETCRGLLVSVDPEVGEVQELGVQPLYFHTYMESLVLL